jgi:hypothetical protein
MTPGKRDPWVAGNPLPGVRFAYNSHVRIVGGPHSGQNGWLVALDVRGAEPFYTVELASGEGDVDVPDSMLSTA